MGVRGGGKACASSPRTRRYFHRLSGRPPTPTLFSAHAEVFPSCATRSPPRNPLLRARGGISTIHGQAVNQRGSSPRTRRYFLSLYQVIGLVFLFSAHAEVFPMNPRS